MSSIKKLISFVFQDEFSLDSNEIQKRAEVVAQNQANENGWTNLILKLSGAPFKDETFTCYPFDVYGIEGSSQGSGSSDSDHSRDHSSSGHGIAAQSL